MCSRLLPFAVAFGSTSHISSLHGLPRTKQYAPFFTASGCTLMICSSSAISAAPSKMMLTLVFSPGKQKSSTSRLIRHSLAGRARSRLPCRRQSRHHDRDDVDDELISAGRTKGGAVHVTH